MIREMILHAVLAVALLCLLPVTATGDAVPDATPDTVAAPSTAPAVPPVEEPRAGRVLHFYHTNDTQGRVAPAPDVDGELPVGGMARVVALLDAARQRGEDPIAVDGGDLLGAAPLSEFDRGRTMVRIMGRAGYEAAVIGNHEFDYGLDTLAVRARESAFPFLAANLVLPIDGSPVQAYRIVRRGATRIGLVGAVSPGQARVINPRRNPGLVISDPAAALQALLPALADSVDLFVGLVHMQVDEAVRLAARFPQVPLWIAGGGASGAARPHDVQLASGAHVVTTPGGRYVGHVEVRLPPTGAPAGRDILTRLLPVGDGVPEEASTARMVATLMASFELSRSERLAEVAEPIADAGQLVADVVRTRTGAEVCVLNRGVFRDHVLTGDLRLADVDRLIRYEDAVVLVDLTGADLKKMASSSATRERPGQRLVFSGFEPGAGRVDGRPLQNDENYRVATTGFLAAGGDEYLKDRHGRHIDPPVSLRSAVVEHLRAHPRMGPGTGIASGTGGTWKKRTKLSGSLSRTGIGQQARRYPGVSHLGGKDAMAWNSILDSRILRESRRGVLTLNVRSTFGQVRELDSFRESADRLQTEWIYSWERTSPAPFLSADVNTVWTVPAGEDRPLTTRLSAGLQRAFGSRSKVRLGFGLERDFAARENELGLEVVPEYRRKFGRDNSFSSNLKVFAGATKTRKLSAQHFNTLLVNLRGNLFVTVDANLFVHREDAVGEVAWKSELQVGLGYTFQRKWI